MTNAAAAIAVIWILPGAFPLALKGAAFSKDLFSHFVSVLSVSLWSHCSNAAGIGNAPIVAGEFLSEPTVVSIAAPTCRKNHNTAQNRFAGVDPTIKVQGEHSLSLSGLTDLTCSLFPAALAGQVVQLQIKRLQVVAGLLHYCRFQAPGLARRHPCARRSDDERPAGMGWPGGGARKAASEGQPFPPVPAEARQAILKIVANTAANVDVK